MQRLIDAEALAKKMDEKTREMYEINGYYDHYTTGLADACEYIEDAPTIEAKPVRHGHWRKFNVPKKWNGPVVRCSECNFGGYTGSKYCPDCGAKMDLEG